MASAGLTVTRQFRAITMNRPATVQTVHYRTRQGVVFGRALLHEHNSNDTTPHKTARRKRELGCNLKAPIDEGQA